MELNINEININKYANGELSGAELIAFEALLQQDEALREKVDSHQFMDAVLYKNVAKDDKDEQIAIESHFNELGEKYFPVNKEEKTSQEAATVISETEPKQSGPNRLRRLLPFAALAAAAALLLFLFIPENDLFAKYFELPNNQAIMGKAITTLDKANKAYNSNNFEEAVILYNEFLLDEPDDPKALLKKGGAELSLERADAAIATFQKLVKNQRYADMANWYLALGYLKKGEKDKTKNYLKLISPNDNIYYNKAQQLLKEL